MDDFLKVVKRLEVVEMWSYQAMLNMYATIRKILCFQSKRVEISRSNNEGCRLTKINTHRTY